jgi:hypothetical protein
VAASADRIDDPVRFMPATPQRNRPQAVDSRRISLVLAPLTAIMLIVMAGLLTLPLRTQRYLLVEGRSARGRVAGWKKTHNGTIVQFEYQVLSGAHKKGSSRPTRKPPQVGSPVVVLYDKDNPGRHSLYPLPLVRLRAR